MHNNEAILSILYAILWTCKLFWDTKQLTKKNALYVHM